MVLQESTVLTDRNLTTDFIPAAHTGWQSFHKTSEHDEQIDRPIYGNSSSFIPDVRMGCYSGLIEKPLSNDYFVRDYDDFDPIFCDYPEETAYSDIEQMAERLFEQYKVCDVLGLMDFIRMREYLIYYLNEISGKIHMFFHNKIDRLILDIVRDPDEDFVGISIGIKHSATNDQAVTFLGVFDDEWWLNVPSFVRKLVTIDIAL